MLAVTDKRNASVCSYSFSYLYSCRLVQTSVVLASGMRQMPNEETLTTVTKKDCHDLAEVVGYSFFDKNVYRERTRGLFTSLERTDSMYYISQ
jgi:hypothetical protein